MITSSRARSLRSSSMRCLSSAGSSTLAAIAYEIGVGPGGDLGVGFDPGQLGDLVVQLDGRRRGVLGAVAVVLGGRHSPAQIRPVAGQLDHPQHLLALDHDVQPAVVEPFQHLDRPLRCSRARGCRRRRRTAARKDRRCSRQSPIRSLYRGSKMWSGHQLARDEHRTERKQSQLVASHVTTVDDPAVRPGVGPNRYAGPMRGSA